MHFSALVILDPTELEDPASFECIADAVDGALQPYGDGREWDWYQIGGRWTGALDGYDPEEDPALLEPCKFCEATGITTAAVAARYPAYAPHVGKECIQCKGKGKRLPWPTSWPHREGDVQPIERVPPDFAPYAIVTPSQGWIASKRYEPEYRGPDGPGRFVAVALPDWRAEHPGHLAVIVDCHN